MWKINNVEIPAPSGMRVEMAENTSAEERNALGEAVLDVFGTKGTLTLSWGHLPEGALAALLGAGDGFFPVKYPDPDGTLREIVCRFGKRRAGLKLMRGGRPVWTDVEMELMER